MSARVSLALVGVMAALAVGAAVLGASESPSHSPKSATSPPASTSLPKITTVPPTTTTTTTPLTLSAPLGRCSFSVLSVSLGRSGSSSQHWEQRVSFRNIGTTICAVHGYPGVALLDATGQQEAQAEPTTVGWVGGMRTGLPTPPTAFLAPGHTATALVEGTLIPTGPAPPTSCPTYSAMLVTPPTSTQSVSFTRPVRGCSPVQVHPVIATTGSTITPGSITTPRRFTVTALTVVGMTGPDAAALTPKTGHHLWVQVTAEQVEPTLVPGTILGQGNVTPYGATVKVTIAVPPTAPCRQTQLSMAYSGTHHANAHDWAFLVVRDTSPQWCTFVGPLTEWGSSSTDTAVTQTVTDQVVPFVLTGEFTAAGPPGPSTGTVQATVKIAAWDTCLAPPGVGPTATDIPLSAGRLTDIS